MKRRLTALFLAAALGASPALSGCASMLQRSYSNSAPHVDYAATAEDPSILRAETYRGLVDAILHFVNGHASQGLIRLYNYTTDVETDLANACLEVTQEDPLGAFIVDDISYEFSRIVSYYEVTVSLTYSHTLEETEAIQPVTGATAIRQKLLQAMSGFSSTLLLKASYYPGNEDSLYAIAVQAYYDTPQAAFGLPGIQVEVYPDSGPQRIISITLDWPEDTAELARKSEQTVAAARQLLSGNPPAGEQYTPEELTALLLQSVPPMDPDGAGDPCSALSGESANQLAHALALELLFHLSGTDAMLVTGLSGSSAACWLIVDTGDGYRHLLYSPEGAQLYTDLEMSGLGCLWNPEPYPDCVDYDADLSGPVLTDPSGGPDGEETDALAPEEAA